MSRGATESLHAAPFGPVVVPRHLEWELEPGILPVNLGKQPPWEVLAQRRNFDCDGVALWDVAGSLFEEPAVNHIDRIRSGFGLQQAIRSPSF